MNQTVRKRLALILLTGLIAVVFLAMPAWAEDAAEEIANTSKFYNTFWALIPSFVAIILALIILLILFIRGRRRPGGYPRSSNAARLQYKRYRKQKQRPIFKRRRNRYK